MTGWAEHQLQVSKDQVLETPSAVENSNSVFTQNETQFIKMDCQSK